MDSPGSRIRTVVVAAVVAFAGFVAGLLVGAPVALVVLPALGVELTVTTAILLSLLSLQGVGFPATAYVYLRLRGLPLSFVPVRVPSLREWGWVVGGYVAAFGLAVAMLVLISAVGAPTAERAEGEMLFANPEALLLLVPLSFLLIGPGEELLFRGIVQGTLRTRFGAAAAIVLANAMFAPAHVTALVGSTAALLVSISVLFVPSLVFGYVYERTENLVVPALVHGAYDATIFGLAYVAVTMGGAGPSARTGAVLSALAGAL
ncbi:MAG: lysostaphin resistance A-like protein [Halobacteriaceae archaeon]